MTEKPYILYTQVGKDFHPMSKVEWEEGKEDEAIAFTAMYNPDTGELFWGKLVGGEG